MTQEFKPFTSLLEFVAGQKSNLFFSWKDFLYQGELSCPPEENHALKHELFSSFYFWRDVFSFVNPKKNNIGFVLL
jgi:hypothetical protein